MHLCPLAVTKDAPPATPPPSKVARRHDRALVLRDTLRAPVERPDLVAFPTAPHDPLVANSALNTRRFHVHA